MKETELERILIDSGKIQKVKARGDGRHFDLIIVSDEFKGLSKLKRQQWIYSLIKQYITDGSLHAVNMQTYTSEEWELKDG